MMIYDREASNSRNVDKTRKTAENIHIEDNLNQIYP